MTTRGVGVRLVGVAKSYGSVIALQSANLVVHPGEFLTLLGPSGSGKTTLLNTVAGYVEPNQGEVFFGEREVTTMPPRWRNVGMVFQNYALFPHLDVSANVGYGLKARGIANSEIAQRVAATLALVKLDGYGARKIQSLSGGQQQRVALARALVIEPDVLLMDEPLGALDRQLRKTVQLELRRLHELHGRTTIYVTHDQEEALILSDRIAVMHNARIVQVGTAAELYTAPMTAFVAGFIGESNLFPVRVLSISDGVASVEVPGLKRDLRAAASPDVAVDRPAGLLIRPEHVVLDAEDGISGVIDEIVYLGEIISARITLASGAQVWSRRLAISALERGANVRVGWAAQHVRIVADR